MKTKKILPLAALGAAGLTALGAGLRRWQLDTAFEPSGLLTPNAPATWALLAFLALGALGVLALTRLAPRGWEGEYLELFHCKNPAVTALYALAGGLTVWAGARGLLLWRLGQETPACRAALCVCLIPAGLAMVYTGALNRSAQRGRGCKSIPLLLPGYCACLWLVTVYQENCAYPNRMEYLFLLLGAALGTVALCAMAGFSFGQGRPRWFCAWAAAAWLCIAVDLAGRGDAVMGPAEAGFGLYLLLQAALLLFRAHYPPALRGPEPDGGDAPLGKEETEGTSDE